MQLDQLFPNILSMTTDEQLVFIASYQNNRQQDLQSEPTEPVKKKTSTVKVPKDKRTIAVSPDDLALLKKAKLI